MKAENDSTGFKTIVSDLFDKQNRLLSVQNDGRSYTYFANFRGNMISQLKIHERLKAYEKLNKRQYVEWIDDNACASIVGPHPHLAHI